MKFDSIVLLKGVKRKILLVKVHHSIENFWLCCVIKKLLLNSRFIAMVGGVGAFLYAKKDIDKRRLLRMRQDDEKAIET